MTTIASPAAKTQTVRKKRHRSRRATLSTAGRWVLICAGLLFAVGPIYWMFASAFKSTPELSLITPTWYPHNPVVDQFVAVLANPEFLASMATSAVVSLITTGVVLFFGSMAAYAVSHWRFPGSERFVALTLFTQLLPVAAVVVPVYLLWSFFGIAGTGIGLGIAYFCITLPVAVWMLTGFFRSIPVELSEAALMDGASRMRTLVSVILPVARPSIVAVGVYTALTCWGEFLFALVLLTGDVHTATINIGSLIGEHNANIGPLMAASVLVTVPPLVVFFFLQRHFVAGLTGGAVKD